MTHTRAFIIASEALLVHIALFQIPATYHRSSTQGFSYQAYRDNGEEGETTVDFSLVAMPPCDPPGAIRFLAADRNNSPTRKRDRNHQPKNIGRLKCHDFVKKRLFIIHYLPLQARLVT